MKQMSYNVTKILVKVSEVNHTKKKNSGVLSQQIKINNLNESNRSPYNVSLQEG
jgi:hypothetical protein